MNWKRQFQTMLVSEELCRERFLIKVAPYSKLAVRSLSTSMARALKSARRPRKNKKTFKVLKLIVQKVCLG